MLIMYSCVTAFPPLAAAARGCCPPNPQCHALALCTHHTIAKKTSTDRATIRVSFMNLLGLSEPDPCKFEEEDFETSTCGR